MSFCRPSTDDPWIRVIAPAEATGELAHLYARIGDARGQIAAVHTIQSLDPEALRLHLELYVHLLFGRSSLARRERELLGVVVSRANRCGYCVAHHTDALLVHEKRAPILGAIREGRWDDLPPRDAALARFAEGLTVAPHEGGRPRVDALRAAEFDDPEILVATEIVAYFNFVNRLVLGLGVSLETPEGRSGFQY